MTSGIPSEGGSVVILAAGKGTRMRSERPKVLHEVAGLPVVAHVVRAALPLARECGMGLFVVVGHGAEEVARAVPEATPIVQAEQRGTGHALSVAIEYLPGGPILLLHGDMPLVTTEVLQTLYEAHRAGASVFTLATAVLTDPAQYGRILRAPDGSFAGVVEFADASASQREIHEINAAIYVMDRASVVRALAGLRADNAQGELYLPDIARILLEQGAPVRAVEIRQSTLIEGINNRFELAEAARHLYERRVRELGEAGTSVDTASGVRVDTLSRVGEDACVGQGVALLGTTVVESGARVTDHAVVEDSRLAAGTRVEGGRLRGVRAGPRARIVGASQIGQYGDERP